MNRNRITLLRRGFPILLIFVGVALLTGCIWLPLPEHSIDSTQVDFRKYTNKGQMYGPLTIGVETRNSVVALLGKPTYTFHQGRMLAYEFDSAGGFQIYPLCFSLYDDGHLETFSLKLAFDDADHLVSWETARNTYQNTYMPAFGRPPLPQFLQEELNKDIDAARAHVNAAKHP